MAVSHTYWIASCPPRPYSAQCRDPYMPSDAIQPLPPTANLEESALLHSLARARGLLGELKGAATSLPNQDIILDTLFLQEALSSSEIENIVTTQDEAFQAAIFAESASAPAKEVARYCHAMRQGYKAWQDNGFISEGMLIDMFRLLKQRRDGYRSTPGTVLRNERTGETVYEPPQDPREVVNQMRHLERFINEPGLCDLDPLVKMALIHHQFESIHPFPDGNGRIGRILNVLYLVHAGLLDSPILYLSRAINRTKSDYYRLLQAVRTEGAWGAWVIYMLEAVADTAHSTLHLISDIRLLMADTKHRMRGQLPRLYSQDLLNNLFRHPYTRIDFLASDLRLSRQTARKYLKQLAERGFVREMRQGRNNYYVNEALVRLFLRLSTDRSS